jgi:hypothetical protein
MTTAETYRTFASETRNVSPCFEAWSLGVADDPEVIAHIDSLPPPKRQPNIVFAAARRFGAEAGPYSRLRPVLLDRWGEIEQLALVRSTQTNEAGRCAPLLPLLASLPQPLALLEVGASAGLCLFPDRYSYRYSDGTSLDPAAGPSPVILDCDVRGGPPLPDRLPDVVWRAGIDLNPLDVHDEEQMAWLELLVWPEHDHRRERLAAAVDLARESPPQIVPGDLNDGLEPLAAEAPPEATLVVFHTAVLAYLDKAGSSRFAATVNALDGHWISNEGAQVLPDVGDTATRPTTYDVEPILLALDGQARAWAGPHGQFLDWL